LKYFFAYSGRVTLRHRIANKVKRQAHSKKSKVKEKQSQRKAKSKKSKVKEKQSKPVIKWRINPGVLPLNIFQRNVVGIILGKNAKLCSNIAITAEIVLMILLNRFLCVPFTISG